jgi:hypothetical protein
MNCLKLCDSSVQLRPLLLRSNSNASTGAGLQEKMRYKLQLFTLVLRAAHAQGFSEKRSTRTCHRRLMTIHFNTPEELKPNKSCAKVIKLWHQATFAHAAHHLTAGYHSLGGCEVQGFCSLRFSPWWPQVGSCLIHL